MPASPAPYRPPFVLFDDARTERAADARLYSAPAAIVTAYDSAQLKDALERLVQAQADGLHAAGYFAYEAGYALEPKLRPLLRGDGKPLCWFGLFETYQRLAPSEVPQWLKSQSAGGGALYNCTPDTGFAAYRQRYQTIESAIRGGDIYQANLTYKLAGQYAGDPISIYAATRDRASAGYGGILYDGRDWQLSFSPELFFTRYHGEITARPMKGTVKRRADARADAKAAQTLQASVKDRAENLMIVDLLRNDIARVACPGSVHVPQLFAIESYPTVHQMTSTVKARLADGKNAADIIRALYPCGSITGAPKIRAMEILRALEPDPRGPYCGSMGRIDAASDGDGDAAFNVAIRTLYLDSAAKTATMGLGSAIVADSDVDSEWRECALKGMFVSEHMQRFDLIETMAFDPASGIARLELHLERMKTSAAELGFEFDRHATRNQIQSACFHIEIPSKVRLLLAKGGAIAIEMQPMPPALTLPARVALTPLPVAADDFRLRHKTSDRAFYDDARRAADGADEVLFVREDGQLTEGSFTHIFAGDAHGGYRTPPLAVGLLPGILRREMIDDGRAAESVLTADDLANSFFIGNSLRGLIPAVLI